MEQKKSYRTALYTRVSTIDQNSEMQLRDLQSYADFEGWQIDRPSRPPCVHAYDSSAVQSHHRPLS